jgi:hypothetical protein
MRTWIDIVESVQQWPKILTGDDLLRYMQTTDAFYDPDDEEATAELADPSGPYAKSSAELRVIPIANLNFNEGSVDEEMVDEYMDMLASGSQPPPIIVHGSEIVDGNHRVTMAHRQGAETILAYVIQ